MTRKERDTIYNFNRMNIIITDDEVSGKALEKHKVFC